MTPNSILPHDEEKDLVFCREYATHGDAILACVRSNIRDPQYPIAVTAARTLERPEIRAGIRAFETVAKSSEPIEITQASIAADMERVYDEAMNTGDWKGAIAAKRLQADVMGLMKTEITVTHKRSVEDFTDAELMRLAGKKMKVIDVEPAALPAALPAPDEDDEFAGTVG